MASFPLADDLTVEWLSSTVGLHVGSFTIERKIQDDYIVELDLTGDDASKDPLTLRAKYGNNEHAISFFKRQIATSGVRTPRCHFAEINQLTGTSLLLLAEEVGTSVLSSPYEDRIEDAVVALAKMHAQYWNDDALREQLLDLHPVSRKTSNGKWAQKLQQYQSQLEGCPEAAIAVVADVVAKFDIEGAYLHNRWRLEGAFSLVNGNYTPLTLMFSKLGGGPKGMKGVATGKKGEVVALDWQHCGVGMPIQDLFMAIVPWMTYLPREFRADCESKMIDLYYETLVQHGVKGFPRTQLMQDYKVAAVNFVPHLFQLMDSGISQQVGQQLHCATDYDMVEHLVISYSDALVRHGALEFTTKLFLEGPSLIRTFQMQDLTQATHLLSHGYANVNEVDVQGISPVAYAAYLGHLPLLDLAILHKAELNVTNKAGSTPLTLAARHKRTKVAVKLLEAGASVDMMNTEHGCTALMFAACNGDKELILALIDHGADIGLQSAQGKTALEHAQQERQLEACELLSNSLLCTHLTGSSPKGFVPSPNSGLMSPLNRDRKSAALHVDQPHVRAGF